MPRAAAALAPFVVKIKFPGDRRWSYLDPRGMPTSRKSRAQTGAAADMRQWRDDLARAHRGLGLEFMVVSA